MGVINSPLVEGGVFSEEVNKKEVTVNGVNSNKKSPWYATYRISMDSFSIHTSPHSAVSFFHFLY